MPNSAEETIRARIRDRGLISFAEFMDVALYGFSAGYYPQLALDEPTADYYTSPSAHPGFGALLAVQIREMWRALGQPGRFHVVEMGAGNGLLARDLIEYAPHLGRRFANALFYVGLDRVSRPSGQSVADHRITTDGVPLRGITGCFLSNELLDSYPVHLFEVRDQAVREIYVTIRDGELDMSLGAPSNPVIEERLRPYLDALPDGYRGEVNLGIAGWAEQVAQALDAGFVATFDYGYDAAELYSPKRSRGTLQTYHMHGEGGGPFARIGRQDITAHVDFSAVVSDGEAVGLNAIGQTTQAELLRGLGFDSLLHGLRTARLPQALRDANLMGLRELVKPDGLGRFRVLVQEKGTGVTDLEQLSPADVGFGGEGLPLPSLQPRHLDLMQGRYPHLAIELDELWPSGEAAEATDRASGPPSLLD